VLASLWVLGGIFDLLRSLLWMREGPTSGILGGYRYALGVLISDGSTSSLSCLFVGVCVLQGYELVEPHLACLTRVPLLTALWPFPSNGCRPSPFRSMEESTGVRAK
jgi:hypothetical protein